MQKRIQWMNVAIGVLGAGVIAGSACCGALASDGADGSDWPQWRGPARTGISTEAAWGYTGTPEPLWVKQLGFGHSSFAISNGLVYTLGYDDEAGLDRVFCFDAASGEEIWQHSYPSEIWDSAHDGGTLTTPTVVGDVVYTSNREGKLFCFDAANGDVRWSHDLRAELELEPPTWGFAASPLVVDGHVIINLGQVTAFDAESGEQVWATEENHGIAYSTPAAFELEGRSYLASLCGDGLAVIDRTDGSEIDFYPWVKRPQIYPMTPVVIGDRIFISAGYDRGCAMLQLSAGKLEELWASRVMRNKMSGCVLFEDHLYGFDESLLKCIDLDGNQKWRRRGLGTGSMSIAGGRLIIVDGRGQVIVAEANPNEYVELSRQKVLDGGTFWSTPVLSHGRVYCRNSIGQMACLDFGGSAATTLETSPRTDGLPSAEAIIARHVEAIGGKAAADRLRSVHMKGPGESLRNTVAKGTVQLHWGAEQGFTWTDEGGFNLGHNGDYGWILGMRSGPAVLTDNALHAVREMGNIRRLFDPAGYYTSLQTTMTTVFDNRECMAIEATTEEGYSRTLFFEQESGLYAGVQGEGIHMVTLREYRDFDGTMLPTHWAMYEPVSGEMDSAVFDEVSINGSMNADQFATPKLVALFSRSPEEIGADNERLTQQHSELLGEWVAIGGAEGMPPASIDVQEGFLRITVGGPEPSILSEPAADGSMYMISADYVVIIPRRDEDGNITEIEITVNGESRLKLERGDGG